MRRVPPPKPWRCLTEEDSQKKRKGTDDSKQLEQQWSIRFSNRKLYGMICRRKRDHQARCNASNPRYDDNTRTQMKRICSSFIFDILSIQGHKNIFWSYQRKFLNPIWWPMLSSHPFSIGFAALHFSVPYIWINQFSTLSVLFWSLVVMSLFLLHHSYFTILHLVSTIKVSDSDVTGLLFTWLLPILFQLYCASIVVFNKIIRIYL